MKHTATQHGRGAGRKGTTAPDPYEPPLTYEWYEEADQIRADLRAMTDPHWALGWALIGIGLGILVVALLVVEWRHGLI